MERRALEPAEIEDRLAELNGWETDGGRLVKKLKFANFAEALEYVDRVGALAEAADHHPDVTFGWGYAEIALTTHDRGGVTDVDIALARQIDTL
ncbi:MAG: 4a-hydroxytetrahydrobiopterin dehydratase [Pyrinomonadaceae bacterium]